MANTPNTTEVRLIAEHGRLCTPRALLTDPLDLEHFDHNPVLIYFHQGGDPDTIQWPNPNKQHLAGSLYDAREMGHIPDVKVVLLPDGTEFEIDRWVE